jgi:Fe(3+) dicitrate transport protein
MNYPAHAVRRPLLIFLFCMGLIPFAHTQNPAKPDSIHITIGDVRIEDQAGHAWFRAVEGMGIYAARKCELIHLDQITANLATNNARQVFNRVAGLNIWENDGGGLQLGIGGRGLSPNRSSNFNTRQNGYDIAADALGYPESYYSPPMEALKRIEVVRGAASLQYGTQFGGMVNFIFKEGPQDKKIEVTARQTGGSYGYFSSFNSLGGTVGKLNYYAFYQGKRGDGWRENSGFTQHTAFGSMKWQLSKRFGLGAEYTYMHYLAQQPGGLTDGMFARDPRQSIRDRNWFQVDWNLAALTADIDIAKSTQLNIRNFGLHARRDALGFLGAINRIDPGGQRDLITGDFSNFGNETRLMHKYDLLQRPAALLLGARYYQGHTTTRQGLASAGSDANFHLVNPEQPENSDYTFPSRNIAAFAEQVFYLSSKWSITPGVRYEWIHTASDGNYTVRNTDIAGNVIYEAVISDSRSRTRSILLGGLGTSFKPTENVEVYGNISRNYRAITFNDMRVVNPNFEIDPRLKDEKGFNADLGFRGTAGKWLEFDLSAFYLRYQDRIGQVLMTDPATFRYYRYRTNVADSRNIGVECFAEADVFKVLQKKAPHTRWTLFGNVAWIDARYVNSQVAAFDGNWVELVPPVNLKTGMNLRHKALKASVQWSYVAGQYSDATNAMTSPNAVEGYIPSYHVMDASVGYSWKWFTLEGSCNNALNAMYFTRRAAAYPGPGIIPSDGRSFFVTLQVKI